MAVIWGLGDTYVQIHVILSYASSIFPLRRVNRRTLKQHRLGRSRLFINDDHLIPETILISLKVCKSGFYIPVSTGILKIISICVNFSDKLFNKQYANSQ
jgi:hypothetical protein